MQKIELDLTDVSEEDAEEVQNIILGATTGLQHYKGIVFKVTDGGEVFEAPTPGK